MMGFFSGKKTYICIIVAALVALVKALKGAGLPALQGIPDGALDYVLALVGLGGAASLRAAVSKTE
jgi:hypothetical protein